MTTHPSYRIPVKSLWEKRMFPENGKIKEIVHYFPVIGRGNIAHDTISHAKVERNLNKSFFRTIREWYCQLFDL